MDARRNLLSDLKEAILVKWPAAQVTTFGSYSAGLSIFMSDLDVSILNVGIEHSASNGNLLATAADMVTSQETGDTGDGDEENGEENGEEDGTEGEGTADDQEIGDEEAGGAEEDGEDWEDMDEEEDTGSGEEDQEGDGMEGEDQEEDEEFGEVTWAIDTKPCTHTPRCPPTGCLPHLLPAAPAPAPAPVSTPPRAQTPTEGIDDDESDFFITTTVSRISPKRSASAADLDLDQDIEDSSSSEEEDKTAAIVHMALNSAPLNQHIHYDESCPAEPLEAPLMGSANSKPRRRSRQKIEEDLDVQILAPPEMLGSAGTNSNRLMQLVQLPPDTFTNSFLIDDDDQLLMGKTGRAGGDLDAAKHRKQQQMLRTLFAFIRVRVPFSFCLPSSPLCNVLLFTDACFPDTRLGEARGAAGKSACANHQSHAYQLHTRSSRGCCLLMLTLSQATSHWVWPPRTPPRSCKRWSTHALQLFL